MTKITAICIEESYTDILIYTVEVQNPANHDEVQKAIQVERERDLGKNEANYVRPLFAFQGDLMPCADWRD